MFSFSIAICPYHHHISPSCFLHEVPLDRFQALCHQLMSSLKGHAAHRCDKGQDVRVKQGERVT
jgi:hypothetical protein